MVFENPIGPEGFTNGRIVGRERELGCFREILAASEAHGSTVLVVGATGMGKSALLREFKRITEEGDFSCTGALFTLNGTDDPDVFARTLFKQVFRLTKIEDGRSWLIGPGWKEQLEALFGLVNADKLLASLLEQEEAPPWEQLLGFLRALSEGMSPRRRVVILVDPEPTLRADSAAAWVAFLRQLPPRILFVIAQRHEDCLAQNPDLQPDGATIDWIELSHLNAGATAQFVDLGLKLLGRDEKDVRSALLAFDGWPFQINTGLILLTRGKTVGEIVANSQRLPNALLNSCASGSKEGFSLVYALAVLEVPVPIGIVSRFLGTTAAETRRTLSEAGLRGTVVEIDEGISLFHGLFAEAVRSQIKADGLWRSFNQRAAEGYRQLLEEDPHDELALMRILPHIRECEDPGTFVATAIHLFPAKRLRGLVQAALSDMEEALRLATDTADEPKILANLGSLFLSRGELDRAEEVALRALEIAEELGQKAEVADSLGILGDLNRNRREWDLAGQRFQRALGLNESLGRKSETAYTLMSLGTLQKHLGDLNQADKNFRVAFEISEALGNKAGMANAIGNLGTVHSARGEYEAADEAFRRALEIEEVLGRKAGMATAFGKLGLLKKERGELDEAEEMFLKAREIDEGLERRSKLATTLGNLGILYREKGEYEKALEMQWKALEINEALRRKPGMATNLGNLGTLYEERGELGKAEAMYERAFEINQALGRPSGKANDFGNMGPLSLERGEYDRAEEIFERTLEFNEAQGRQAKMAKALGKLGNIRRERGDFDGAEELFLKALEKNEALGRKLGVANDMGRLGSLFIKRGEYGRAEGFILKALEMNEEMGRRPKIANGVRDLGTSLWKRGEYDRAEECYLRALEINEALGRRPAMADDYGNLGTLFLEREEYDRAEEMYQNALEICKALGRESQMIEGIGKLETWYRARGKHDRAQNLHLKALEITQALGRGTGSLDEGLK